MLWSTDPLSGSSVSSAETDPRRVPSDEAVISGRLSSELGRSDLFAAQGLAAVIDVSYNEVATAVHETFGLAGTNGGAERLQRAEQSLRLTDGMSPMRCRSSCASRAHPAVREDGVTSEPVHLQRTIAKSPSNPLQRWDLTGVRPCDRRWAPVGGEKVGPEGPAQRWCCSPVGHQDPPRRCATQRLPCKRTKNGYALAVR
jgi:hypothetical protein